MNDGAQAATATSTSRTWYEVLGLAALAWAAFGLSLRFGFVYDDRWTLLDNPIVRSPRNLVRLLGPELARAGVPDAGRPVMLASEILDWSLFRGRALGFHLQNLLWHTGVVLLVRATLRRWGFGAGAALAAAALLAVNPLVAEAVAVINYREDLLAAFFVWLALFLVAEPRPLRIVGAAAALAIGALGKENASVAPLLLLAFVGATQAVGVRAAPPRRYLGAVLALAAAVVLVFAWRAWVMGGAGVVSVTAEVPAAHRDLAFAVPRSAAAFVAGVAQFLVPVGLAPEYPDPPGGLLGWAAVLLVIATTAVAVRVLRVLPGATLGWLFAVIAYLPNFGFVPLTNLRADRYLYLASGGLALAAVTLAAALLAPAAPRIGRAPAVTAVAAVALLGLLARAHARTFRDDVTLFTAATRAAPNSQRAWIGQALAELRRGETVAALAAAEAALALGDAPRAHEARGLVALAQGDFVVARQALAHAAGGAGPGHRPQVLYNLALAERAAGDLAAAQRHLEEAEALAPRFERPGLQLADLALARGDLAAARAQVAGVLARVPESIDAWRMLVRIEERAGDAAAAARARAKVDAASAH